jgi:ribosome-associated toxin RatA of RatAB toxin-antitoxin module
MGQRVASETVIAAPRDEVYAVIADLDSYPDWAPDVRETEVLERDTSGLPELVAFAVDARIAVVHYTLQYQHDRPDRVRWRLVEGEMLDQLDGSYDLHETEDGATNVRYSLEVRLAVPLPSFIQRRAANVILETGLAGLRERVEGS